jgi:hypothetical protein
MLPPTRRAGDRLRPAKLSAGSSLLEIFCGGFAVTRLGAAVLFVRTNCIGGRRTGLRRVERDAFGADALADAAADHDDVNDFALHWRMPLVQSDFGYLIVGLADPSDLDVPDVLAGHEEVRLANREGPTMTQNPGLHGQAVSLLPAIHRSQVRTKKGEDGPPVHAGGLFVV